MKKVIKTAILSIALLAANSAFAQVSHGGEPLFNHNNAKASTNTRYLPVIDNDHYLQQDLDGVKGSGPMRVAIGQPCDINVLADAKKTKDANGTHYTLAIQSPGATYVGLNFSTFELAEGAELFIYDETGEFVLGKYMKSDVQKDGSFFTQAIPGSTAFIEYNVPAEVEPGKIQLTSVRHGYKDIFQMIDGIYSDAEAAMKGPHGTAEGDCHIDVKCPLGEGWDNQIRATVALEITFHTNMGYDITGMCSGALINNTRQDRTPYVLSAFHCQDGDEMLEDIRDYYPNITITRISFISYFLYQKYQCNGNGGRSNYSITGADIMAKYDYDNGSDMLLLLLKDTVPFLYTPYFAGWDRTPILSPNPGACIHHPGGDFKKISIPKSIRGKGAFYEVNWFGNSDPEKKGITEQGSSGSPLFNADKRIIGQLYAGASFCNKPDDPDYYGRLSTSWNGGGADNNRLKNWLDPDNTGVSFLDGLNYTDDDVAINVVGQQSNKLTVYPNPSNGLVRFDIDYIGNADYKVFDQSGRCVKEGSTVLTSTVQSADLRSLPKGVYTLSLRAGSKTYSSQIVIK